MEPETLKRLPFDLYARYRLAAEIAARISATRMLDVGGGPGVLDAFYPQAETFALDVTVPEFNEPAPRLVVADGGRLPFDDDTFDLVVALDTLEHVEQGQRDGLIAESLRVSRGWVFIAGPCATPGVAEADAALLAFVRAKFGESIPAVATLTEHLAFGHPDPAAIEAQLRGSGATVGRIPSGRLDRWLPMMITFYELMALGRDDPVERMQAWYNDAFTDDDLRDPAYRQAFVARLPDAHGPEVDDLVADLLPDESVAPRDTVGLRALQALLESELGDATERHRAEVAELEQRLADAERRVAELTERAEAAEQHLAALLAFRDRVLAHPAVRLRRALRRPFTD